MVVLVYPWSGTQARTKTAWSLERMCFSVREQLIRSKSSTNRLEKTCLKRKVSLKALQPEY